MKSQFMIQDRPNLVKYFVSKNPIHLLLFVLPLLVYFAFQILKHSIDVQKVILCFVAGVLYWSFLEYVIHRFAYHSRYPFRWLKYFLGSFHMYHHMDMSDRRVLNAGFLMIYGLIPIFLSPFILMGLNFGLVSALGLGLVSYYYFYECVHFILHYKVYETGYLGYIQRYHLYHHDRAPLKNFGNTSHLWDVLLGTYDDRYKNYVMPLATKKTLITENKKVASYV